MNLTALEALYRDMDQLADTFPSTATFGADCWIEFRELLGAEFPRLTLAQQHAAFKRWCEHYLDLERERRRQRMERVAALWAERDRLHAQARLLPEGSEERKAIETAIWNVGRRVGEEFRPTRPEAAGAVWVDAPDGQ